MGYIQRHLIQGERVVYQTRLHWTIFFSKEAAKGLWLGALLDYWTNEFVITDKRIVIKIGWIWRKTLEMNLSKIESVQVEQSVPGRLLGYGEVVIIGTGGSREHFHRIAHPLQFRRAFQELV